MKKTIFIEGLPYYLMGYLCHGQIRYLGIIVYALGNMNKGEN